MSQWVNGSVDGSMGRMGPGSMGQWVMGLGYDGSDGSWVTNGDPWSTLTCIIRHSLGNEENVGLANCRIIE